MASRHHCVLSRKGKEFHLEDNGSQNGTLVEGRRVESQRIRIGEEIAIGRTRLRLDEETVSTGEEISDCLDGWVLERRLGDGRRAQSWLASRTGEPGRFVFRVLDQPPSPIEPGLEASRIVPTIETGTCRKGHYVVRAFVEGENLLTRRERDLLTPGEGVALARQMLAELDSLHEIGWVHGHLSPGNVVFDEAGEVWLTDGAEMGSREDDLASLAFLLEEAIHDPDGLFSELSTALWSGSATAPLVAILRRIEREVDLCELATFSPAAAEDVARVKKSK